MAPRSRPTVAFVLSGGASLGAVQVGMLRATAPVGASVDEWGHADMTAEEAP